MKSYFTPFRKSLSRTTCKRLEKPLALTQFPHSELLSAYQVTSTCTSSIKRYGGSTEERNSNCSENKTSPRRTGHIDDQENPGQEASFNAPQDKRVIILGRVKRERSSISFHCFIVATPTPLPAPTHVTGILSDHQSPTSAKFLRQSKSEDTNRIKMLSP